YDFCGNGIVFADRSITPKMQEVKYCYQYVDMVIDEKTIQFTNNYLFSNLNEYIINIELYKDGQKIDDKEMVIDLNPGDTTSISNPYHVNIEEGQYVVVVRFFNQDKHEVAHEQFVYPYEKKETWLDGKVTIIEDFMDIGVIGQNYSVKFSKVKGLTSFKVDKEEMVRVMPKPNFFRASTNNDVENKYGYRYAKWYAASMFNTIQFRKIEKEETVCKVYFDYILPSIEKDTVHVIFTMYADHMDIDMENMPGFNDIEMPAFGMMFHLYKEYDQVTYFGYGPDENYIDRNKGALLGKFEYNVRKNVTPYLYPQECGNRTNVQSIEVSNGEHSIIFEGKNMEFSAIPYTPFEMENARHQDELPEPYQTVVCIYESQMGVGGDDTWGAKTLDEFLLSNKDEHTLHISVKGK
ncbi:MAG: glycoside hydrolase family 2, partial [Holdemanella sp.]|nr:glycoside hydrolase family 2 [Holdemanella sp.]